MRNDLLALKPPILIRKANQSTLEDSKSSTRPKRTQTLTRKNDVKITILLKLLQLLGLTIRLWE